MSVIICYHYLDTEEKWSVCYHSDMEFGVAKYRWYEKHEIDHSTDMLFLDKDDRLIEDNIRIKNIPQLFSWANIAKVTVKSYKYVIDSTFAKVAVIEASANAPKKKGSTQPHEPPTTYKRAWQVEPTQGRETFGRWIVRPDVGVLRDSDAMKFDVFCLVLQPDNHKINWYTVTLSYRETFHDFKRHLADQLSLEAGEVDFCYQYGSYYRTDAGLRHLTASGKRNDECMHQVLRDDATHALVDQSETVTVMDTFRPCYDDTPFSIPVADHALVAVHPRSDFLRHEAGAWRPVPTDRRPLEDPRVGAFVDGVSLYDRRQAADSGPARVFLSYDSGSEFAEVTTGAYVASHEAVLAEGGAAVPEEARSWHRCVVLLHLDADLPQWRLPPNGSLDLQVRDGDCVEVHDGRLRSTADPGRVDRRQWVNLSHLPPSANPVSAVVSAQIRRQRSQTAAAPGDE